MDNVRVCLETVTGSTAYNLARAGSDVDVKGVVLGPAAWYLSFCRGPETVRVNADHIRYNLTRFLALAAESNPTVLEMLYVRDDMVISCDPVGEALRERRDMFLSAAVAERFAGYAHDQLRRIRTHRAWLLNPLIAPPSRAEFGLPERTVVPADQLAAAETLLEEGAPIDVSANFLEVLARERRYRSAATNWSNYQRWLKARNPARAQLEARFGYDTKHAMHLIRLGRMAAEALATGTLNVWRTDRDELLAVRDGALTYDELLAAAEANDRAIHNAKSVTVLDEQVDAAAVEELCVRLLTDHLGGLRT